jgi:hypothetical protein
MYNQPSIHKSRPLLHNRNANATALVNDIRSNEMATNRGRVVVVVPVLEYSKEISSYNNWESEFTRTKSSSWMAAGWSADDKENNNDGVVVLDAASAASRSGSLPFDEAWTTRTTSSQRRRMKNNKILLLGARN